VTTPVAFRVMPDEPSLIIQVPAGGALDRQLSTNPPPSLANAAVEHGPTDEQGVLEPPIAGQVVLSVPSPEALHREAGTLGELVDRAGTSTEPIVIVVEAAEELREEEVVAVVAAADHAPRPVILRIIRNG
jgi:hypothetical protein